MKPKIKFEVVTKIEKTGLTEQDQGDFLEYIPKERECDVASSTFYFRLCSILCLKNELICFRTLPRSEVRLFFPFLSGSVGLF